MGRDLLDVIHRYENYVSIFPIHRSITVATLKLETDYRCIIIVIRSLAKKPHKHEYENDNCDYWKERHGDGDNENYQYITSVLLCYNSK